jgi:hypothetical protein
VIGLSVAALIETTLGIPRERGARGPTMAPARLATTTVGRKRDGAERRAPIAP